MYNCDLELEMSPVGLQQREADGDLTGVVTAEEGSRLAQVRQFQLTEVLLCMGRGSP